MAVNVIPIIGVAFWDWSLMMILVLYWIESGIVGVINVFKIARAEGGDGPAVSVDGNRVTIRISGMASGMGRSADHRLLHPALRDLLGRARRVHLPAAAVRRALHRVSCLDRWTSARCRSTACCSSALLLAASHTVSFFTNYLGRGEYLRATPTGQMMSVYGRVVALHVTVVAGAALIGAFGAPIAALYLLVGIKTAIDLVLHLREHRRAAPSTGLTDAVRPST